MGRVEVSESDRKELKRARKEGRIAEAMLDRRAALKRCFGYDDFFFSSSE